MDEGTPAGAKFIAPDRLNNRQLFNKPSEKSKLAVRRVHGKKTAAFGQLQKKLNKGKNQGKKLDMLVTSSSIDDDEEHKGVHHEWQNLVLSTSATESVGEENMKKLISKIGKKKKKSSNKSCFNDFVEHEDPLKSTPFVFQRRLSRIDWRKLHTIDVDKIIREADVGTLEAILDTIAFSDVQGEDTRNFTEANFIKIFRLAQLMVEYLLHVQELLAAQRTELLANETMIVRRLEKYKGRLTKIVMDLTQCRHDLKQAKKTLRMYEAMLKVQGENQQQQMQQQQSVAQHMVWLVSSSENLELQCYICSLNAFAIPITTVVQFED
ncbi:hypothetical protein R1sor_004024 [Riccia sorocarpa]|uniref:Cilium assembly protein DZIP1 N-terminal domain-containing protein n=1 Tax=Riccia sorocarpa TaxID=122646 RepID=A0ABD3H664_9MARC